MTKEEIGNYNKKINGAQQMRILDVESRQIYGYARISRPQQSIARQIRNIKIVFPTAVIVQEAYTGTKMDRPEWNKLYKKVKAGDTIVFDSVSRMSRNADEGVHIYFELYERGIKLIFLKEHYIDTAVYAENMRDKIELQGTDEDEIFKGLNKKPAAMEKIKKYSKAFDGTLTDKECMALIGLSNNTFYKYKKEMKDTIYSV